MKKYVTFIKRSLGKLYPTFDPYDFTRSLIDSFVSGVILYVVAMPDGQGWTTESLHAVATGAAFAGVRSAWKYMVLGLRQAVGESQEWKSAPPKTAEREEDAS